MSIKKGRIEKGDVLHTTISFFGSEENRARFSFVKKVYSDSKLDVIPLAESFNDRLVLRKEIETILATIPDNKSSTMIPIKFPDQPEPLYSHIVDDISIPTPIIARFSQLFQ